MADQTRKEMFADLKSDERARLLTQANKMIADITNDIKTTMKEVQQMGQQVVGGLSSGYRELWQRMLDKRRATLEHLEGVKSDLEEVIPTALKIDLCPLACGD